MRLIELTQYDCYRPGDKILIPVEKIQLIKPASRGGTSYIFIEGLGDINVLESTDTIRRIIEDLEN